MELSRYIGGPEGPASSKIIAAIIDNATTIFYNFNNNTV
jgi:hypothetical protein